MRREKLKFWARLTNGNGVIPSLEKVVCEIALPKRPNGEVHATFFPTIEQYRHSIRQTLYRITRIQTTITERTFVSLYSAIETLIYEFRRQHDLEFVISAEEEWKKLKKKLKKAVSSVAKEDDVLAALPSKREYLYDKLDELNRISFGRALKAFCAYYAVDISDLWPLTGMVTSLSDIRNRLVHGYRFQPASYLMLMSAHENLRLIAERMVLAMLEWPISNSRADSGFLSLHNSLYKSWKTDWKEMTTLLRSEITIPEESQISTENIT